MHAVVDEEADGVHRVEREQHGRLPEDAADAQDRERREPEDHDRAEDRADAGGAAALEDEEQHEDDDRDRDDVRLEERRGHFEPFDRAQHGDGRRDHAVAVEQRRAEDADARSASPAPAARASWSMPDEPHQRQDAALAAVVEADDVDRDT